MSYPGRSEFGSEYVYYEFNSEYEVYGVFGDETGHCYRQFYESAEASKFVEDFNAKVDAKLTDQAA